MSEQYDLLFFEEKNCLSEVLRDLIAFNGIRVTSVNSEEEVLQILERITFNFLVVNLQDFEKVNYPFLKHIRNLPIAQQLRIILLTYRSFSEDEYTLLRKFKIIYYKKPVLPNDFVSKINELLV